MGKPDEDIVEKAFVVRSYGKGELASMYIDGVQQQTAVKQFNEWIRTAPGLEQQLQETGMAPTARRYTPRIRSRGVRRRKPNTSPNTAA